MKINSLFFIFSLAFHPDLSYIAFTGRGFLGRGRTENAMPSNGKQTSKKEQVYLTHNIAYDDWADDCGNLLGDWEVREMMENPDMEVHIREVCEERWEDD